MTPEELCKSLNDEFPFDDGYEAATEDTIAAGMLEGALQKHPQAACHVQWFPRRVYLDGVLVDNPDPGFAVCPVTALMPAVHRAVSTPDRGASPVARQLACEMGLELVPDSDKPILDIRSPDGKLEYWCVAVHAFEMLDFARRYHAWRMNPGCPHD